MEIRPRCHYCRTSSACPSLACVQCLNRVIIPLPYRTASDTASSFLCPACTTNTIQTIENEAVTTKALVTENGLAWLGLKPLEGVLEGKSAFKLMSMHGPSGFGSSPNVSGSPQTALILIYRGKTLHNSLDVLSQVEGRAEDGLIDLGTCSLCYDDVRRDRLFKACGRTGCEQTVDEKCLQEWVRTLPSGIDASSFRKDYANR